MGRRHSAERSRRRGRKKSLEDTPEERDLHTLASHLRCTVEELKQTLSAKEYVRWMIWLETERQGPRWEAVRQAQLMAALFNGPMRRRDNRAWDPSDFMPPDPWAPARPRLLNPADELAAQLGLPTEDDRG